MASGIPHLAASDLSSTNDRHHLNYISDSLAQRGIVKVSLNFADPSSQYLQSLIHSLHKHHGHRLPISHSASAGWFWDVRPAEDNFQTPTHQATSETMNKFPWHTDCCYENPIPRYFALQVLQHDRFGGGTLSVMNVARLMERLSSKTKQTLTQPEFKITIPKEFVKDSGVQDIVGSVLSTTSQGQHMMRFREDIFAPLTDEAQVALQELITTLRKPEIQEHASVQLAAHDLPSQSVILIDNWRWLHSRNNINDPERHLRRVRWDAVPFGQGMNHLEAARTAA